LIQIKAFGGKIQEDNTLLLRSPAMHTEETMTAEKIRRKSFVTLIGICADCGQPVKGGQEFLRTDHGIQHALCFYDPSHAKRVREDMPKAKQ
jgi:hypothetical protein